MEKMKKNNAKVNDGDRKSSMAWMIRNDQEVDRLKQIRDKNSIVRKLIFHSEDRRECLRVCIYILIYSNLSGDFIVLNQVRIYRNQFDID